ncbi:hypothetical protein KBZ21_24995 [Streptomyces sp. A73]|nr:hypothetical protein [Streptomyces sp. A73]
MTESAATTSTPARTGVSAPSPAPGPAADEGLARRLRALACTAPLHDLDTRKANLAGEYSTYEMAELALAAIDLVTLQMDFDTGADHEQIVAKLLPRVAAQAPSREPAEHERVARWVLENMINVGSVDRGFRAVYGTFGPDGSYVRRDYDFKLIEEVPGPGGSVYLRTTDEAVNVLVGALDTDVTSAQIAAAMELLELPPDAPRRLSGLLADARRRGEPDLPYLIALLAVHAASPPVGTAYRQGEERLLFAVDDGTPLEDPEFGGADLIVGTALLDAAGMTAARTEAA